MGIPSSTFFKELTEGLTRFCSIREIKPLVTPARFANSRCDSPYICRTAFKWAPTFRLIMSIIIDSLGDNHEKIGLNVDFPYHLSRSMAKIPQGSRNECPADSCSRPRRSRRILDAVHGQSTIQGESSPARAGGGHVDRKSTRLNSSHT